VNLDEISTDFFWSATWILPNPFSLLLATYQYYLVVLINSFCYSDANFLELAADYGKTFYSPLDLNWHWTQLEKIINAWTLLFMVWCVCTVWLMCRALA